MARRPFYSISPRLGLILFLIFSGSVGVQAQLTFSTVPSTCTASNGSIAVTDPIGTGPYQFYIDDGSGSVGPVSSATATYTYTGLLGGKTYYFTAFDQNGGGTMVSGSVSLGDLAAPGISAVAQAATCINNDGSLLVTAIGGNGPFTYQLNGGFFGSSGSFAGLASGSVTAAIQDINNCIASTLAVIPLDNDLTASIGNVGPICEGTGVQLPAVSTGTSFSWDPVAGLSDPAILDPIASPSVTTTYTLTVGKGICPSQSIPVTVTVNPAPVPNAGPDKETCYGKTVILQGSGGTTYHWTPSTGLTNPNVPLPIVIKPDTTITYALSVTDANGCSSLQPDSVTVNVTPPFDVVAGPDTVVSVGQSVQLYSVSTEDPGGSSYQWTPVVGVSNPLISNPVTVLTTPQEVDYIVQVTTPAGCTAVDTVVVKALAVMDILVPNAFTPNNDGHNDVLRPIMPGIKTLKYFTIFDRWGRQVFTTSNTAVGWDGTVKGEAIEAGVFVWMAMGVDINGKVLQRKGTVVLVR